MKHIVNFIYESTKSPALTLSSDEVKNAIYKVLVDSQAKFIFKVNDVDSFLDKVDPSAKWLNDVMETIKPKRGSKVYRAAIWNDGHSWDENYPYNQAEFVFHKNNTDVAWYFIVNGKKVECWMHERKYYGMKSITKILKNFTI